MTAQNTLKAALENADKMLETLTTSATVSNWPAIEKVREQILDARDIIERPPEIQSVSVFVEYGETKFTLGHQGFTLKVPEEDSEGMTRDQYLNWYADNLRTALNRTMEQHRREGIEEVENLIDKLYLSNPDFTWSLNHKLKAKITALKTHTSG